MTIVLLKNGKSIRRITFIIKGMNTQCGDFIQVDFNRMMENPDPRDFVDENFAVYCDSTNNISGIDRGLLAAAVRGD